MDAIKAKVRNGRVETDMPLNLPDGTELLIFHSNAAAVVEDDWDNTPQGIAAWLKWYDALQPLIFTPEERHAWRENQRSRKEWEVAHAEERAEKLRGLWG
jgi:hypothetical protein